MLISGMAGHDAFSQLLEGMESPCRVLVRPVASCFGVVWPFYRGCEAADSIPAHSAEFFLGFSSQEALSFDRNAHSLRKG